MGNFVTKLTKLNTKIILHYLWNFHFECHSSSYLNRKSLVFFSSLSLPLYSLCTVSNYTATNFIFSFVFYYHPPWVCLCGLAFTSRRQNRRARAALRKVKHFPLPHAWLCLLACGNLKFDWHPHIINTHWACAIYLIDCAFPSFLLLFFLCHTVLWVTLGAFTAAAVIFE